MNGYISASQLNVDPQQYLNVYVRGLWFGAHFIVAKDPE